MSYERSFFRDKLKVEIYRTKEEMGRGAAGFVAGKIVIALKERGHANIILGTGASQYPFLNAFLKKDLDWKNINLFHLDEYIGLTDQHPASFRKFLKDRVTDIVKPGKVFYLNGNSNDIRSEIERYSKLLKDNPADVACIGIGENGHIAFNDPAFADFNDRDYLKVVEMDQACRKQQVGEGWFPSIDDVPAKAITLTIPAIMDSKVISCTVPDERKATAVFNTLTGEITESCPATVLRTHSEAVLFLDNYAAARIK
ncbi:MAG: glucosamine-6-phosphate deaminase [Bacteroidales bacterium]|nr:glucosamine-6-phosphate deaminase [Bacteroidales bacterium]